MQLVKFLNFITKLKNRHFLIFDIILFIVSPLLSLFIRFENFNAISNPIISIIFLVFTFSIIKFLLFFKFGLYKRLWKYASIDEVIKIIVVGILMFYSELFLVLVLNRINPIEADYLWLTLPLIDTTISILGFSFIRLMIRIIIRIQERFTNGIGDSKRVLIIGAGEAGLMIVEEIQSNPKLKLNPIGFIDDDRNKTNTRLRAVPILGTTDLISSIVDKYKVEEIIIAIPTASGKTIRDIYKKCEKLKTNIRTMPGVFELLNESVSINKLRNVQIGDLLRREPVQIDDIGIKELILNKRILITGAGGSIGSEIAKQVMSYKPKSLTLIGQGENSIFDVFNNLKNYFYNDEEKINQIIADIRNKKRLDKIFRETKPEIVFHAAAHKHVPLMERNQIEAVSNNILGTLNLCELAVKYNIQQFVSISTDKAVNPTSFMGATKRVAEFIVNKFSVKYDKKFVSVRFGNVLGSRGSVVPYFNSQIAKGGPITITHPDITRFFMTIPEAVQLVLQAAAIANIGEIYVLDMGKPIKILDLAKDMIKLSGLEIQEDIEIVFSGLRPGEKLFEEIFYEKEEYSRTRHEKIYKIVNHSNNIPPNFDNILSSLISKTENYSTSDEELIRLIKQIVPEYSQTIFQNLV